MASRVVKNIVRQVRNREMYGSLSLLVKPNWLFHRARQSEFVRDQFFVYAVAFRWGLSNQKYGAGFLYILGDLCPWRDYVCIEFLKNGTLESAR